MNTETLDFPTIMPDCEYPATPPTPPTASNAAADTAPVTEIIDMAEVGAKGAIVKYSRTEAALATLREKYAGKTFDLTTTKGDKEARAARLELKTLRTGLEARRKEFKAPAIEYGKLIDSEAKRITLEIEALEDPISDQIVADETRRENERLEHERIAAERRAEFEAKIATIRGYVAAAQGLPSERIAKGLAFVEAMAFGEDWAEFASPAAAAQGETAAALRDLLASAKNAEAAEAQRIENERIAAGLAEQQQRLADAQAELDRRAAVLAEAERVAAATKLWNETEAKAREEAAAQEPRDTEAERIAQRRSEPVQVEYTDDPHAPIAVTDLRNVDLGAAAQQAGAEPGDAAQVEISGVGTVAVTVLGPTEQPAAEMPAQAPVKPPATLKLGDICKRLGFNVTEAFVRDTLKISIVKDARAVLILASDWTILKFALVAHVGGLE